MNPMLLAQGLGFMRRYIELDIEENKPGAEQALEWFNIIDSGVTDLQSSLRAAENKLFQVRLIAS